MLRIIKIVRLGSISIMKLSYILITTLILLIWYSFFSHLWIFIGLELFSIISIMIFLYYEDSNIYFVWVVFIGIIIDLIIGRWLGISLIANVGSLFICVFADRYLKLIGSDEQKTLFAVVYVTLCSIIIYIMSIVSIGSVQFEVGIIASRIVVNLILVFVLNEIFSKTQTRREIKV